jgi:diguanylate cyclase (GGDEF)-like protein
MATLRLKTLAQTVARHPWSSLQDALLLAMGMLVSALLALQYNLFFFVPELSDPKREISLPEDGFLTILLALCIVIFILRRLYEERRDVARQATAKTRMKEFRWQASRDSLTNLANRRSMLKALTAATSSPVSEGRKHAFFLIDLNDFKRINDLYGHAFGDRILQVIARRLRKSTRPNDLLARLGGDEFALLCYDVDRDTALAIASRFIASLEAEIRAGGHSHSVGASIGAVLLSDDGSNAEEVLHHADLAMYRAKNQNESSVVFFEPTATQQIVHHTPSRDS